LTDIKSAQNTQTLAVFRSDSNFVTCLIFNKYLLVLIFTKSLIMSWIVFAELVIICFAEM